MKQSTSFDWTHELNKTVTHSLVTTFGLDFLLFQDKTGGDVDTIHNVRKGIWATQKEKDIYDNREAYDSKKYHSDSRYRNRGKQDKQKHQTGELHDAYRNTTMKQGEKRQLDHIIPSSEIDNDAGRILAELNGVTLANQESNFQSTLAPINNLKRDKSMGKFVQDIPQIIQNQENQIKKKKAKLETMPEATPKQRHEKEKLKNEIKSHEDNIKTFKSCDKEAMLESDKKARQLYDQQINHTYYTSSKFLKNTGTVALSQGFRMGARQAIGIVLAEIWFELKEALPSIINECKENFKFQTFWRKTKITLTNIFERVKLRFKEMLTSFKDGFFGGILASITTTVINIFTTSTKLLGKLIRESWSNLVQIIKLLTLNPDKLSTGNLFKEVTRLIMISIATTLGVILNQCLAKVLVMPFGGEISAFLSALFTGLLIVGVGYFLDYSQVMQKVWNFLDSLKNKYDAFLDHMKEINQELNNYVTELAKIEFNLDVKALAKLSDSLLATSNENEVNDVLKAEVQRRNIELPFQMGNDKQSNQSTFQWLKGLQPKP